MKTLKEKATDWANEVLESEEYKKQDEGSFAEFYMLGSLTYSADGTRIKRFDVNQRFKVKPVEIINGEIVLDEG